MILTINTAGKEFQVTKAPYVKLDPSGNKRIHRESGETLWSTQVVVTDEDGGAIISINTHGDAGPNVQVGDLIEPWDLVAIPWNSNGRSGVSYVASKIEPVED